MRTIPVVSFPNASEDILAYLAKRTADTIGKQVDRSQAIIVGRVEKSESWSVPVRSEDVESLKPWLSEDGGAEPSIFVQVTAVQAEEWLAGLNGGGQVNIAYVYPSTLTPSRSDLMPVFYTGDRGLLFLREVPSQLPYASYIPHPAYQLAEGETGVRKFLVTDYDDKGRPFIRDETAKVEETIAAVRWYDSLRKEKPDNVRKALLAALDSPNSHVSRHAVRALAHMEQPCAAEALKERLQRATPDLRVPYMLGLWIIGERKLAGSLLEGLFQTHGKYAWLDAWGIKPTLVRKGEPVETLYGPDPSEVRGE